MFDSFNIVDLSPLGGGGGGSGGTWVALNSATASSSATVEMTSSIDSTYKQYRIVIRGLRPATDTNLLRMRVSTDGGSTWKSAASDYRYAMQFYSDNSSGGALKSTGDAFIYAVGCSGIGLANDSTHVSDAFVDFYNPSGSSHHKMFNIVALSRGNNDAVYWTKTAGLYKGATTAINGIQFYMFSGNIAEGEFILYGLKES